MTTRKKNAKAGASKMYNLTDACHVSDCTISLFLNAQRKQLKLSTNEKVPAHSPAPCPEEFDKQSDHVRGLYQKPLNKGSVEAVTHSSTRETTTKYVPKIN